ncbi:MAG: WYL domain-containing protein, partial [Mycobacterium sp.]
LRGSEDVLGILLSAIDSRQAVRFQHRPLPTEPYVERTVEPWGVVTARGRWYLVGHDRDRNATRTFRLSRIDAGVQTVGPAGSVTRPDGVDLRAIVEKAIGEAPSGVTATVWVADGRATALRRTGTSKGSRTIGGRAGEVIELDLGTRDRLTREIAGYGADALVLEPAALRADVVARLTAQADRA